MKDVYKFVITMILTMVMTLSVLVVASKIFVPKWVNHDGNMMTFIIKGFYEEPKDSLDVIFMGNSDTYRGINPIEMYKKYGFTSYNFVSAGQRMWIANAMFEDAINRQKPKLIMFNVDGLFSTNQANFGNNSKVYDNMPFSLTKAKELFDSNYEATNYVRIGHLLSILNYHYRYNELTYEDKKYAFYDYHYALKGMDMVAYRIPYTGNKDYMEDTGERESLPDINVFYLDNFRKKCQDHDIKLVLFHTVSSDSANYSRYNAVKEYADKFDLDYIDLNFYAGEIGIDWQTDTSDGGDHLNLFGAEKSSVFLGKYLVENYELPDHRNEKAYSKWDDDYEEYLKLKQIEIEEAKKQGLY